MKEKSETPQQPKYVLPSSQISFIRKTPVFFPKSDLGFLWLDDFFRLDVVAFEVTLRRFRNFPGFREPFGITRGTTLEARLPICSDLFFQRSCGVFSLMSRACKIMVTLSMSLFDGLSGRGAVTHPI